MAATGRREAAPDIHTLELIAISYCWLVLNDGQCAKQAGVVAKHGGNDHLIGMANKISVRRSHPMGADTLDQPRGRHHAPAQNDAPGFQDRLEGRNSLGKIPGYNFVTDVIARQIAEGGAPTRDN